MKRRVLIVEDDRLSRVSLARLVQSLGHETSTAENVREGMDGLAALPTHLLLDLNLPDGLGTNLLRRVREFALPIKVAIVSASDDPALLKEVIGLRPEAMFKKPVRLDALLRWIGES
jgi:DNA-binding NarL/FixJ family response regulator